MAMEFQKGQSELTKTKKVSWYFSVLETRRLPFSWKKCNCVNSAKKRKLSLFGRGICISLLAERNWLIIMSVFDREEKVKERAPHPPPPPKKRKKKKKKKEHGREQIKRIKVDQYFVCQIVI